MCQKQEKKGNAQREKKRGSYQGNDLLLKSQRKAKGQMAPWKEQESKWLRGCLGGARNDTTTDIYDQLSQGTAPRTGAFSIPRPGSIIPPRHV